MFADDENDDTIHVGESEAGIILPLASRLATDVVAVAHKKSTSAEYQEVRERPRPMSSIGFSNERDRLDDRSSEGYLRGDRAPTSARERVCLLLFMKFYL